MYTVPRIHSHAGGYQEDLPGPDGPLPGEAGVYAIESVDITLEEEFSVLC